jgi:hypothetical protein
MAARETLTRNGTQQTGINIDAPVGPTKVARVKNLKGDVLLIQGVLFVLAKRTFPPVIGLQSMDQVPTPDGIYDGKTEAAILAYQTRYRPELLQADGVIDPASYQHRNVVSLLSSRLMTITHLHEQLRVLFDDPDYTPELKRLVPQLASWLR